MPNEHLNTEGAVDSDASSRTASEDDSEQSGSKALSPRQNSGQSEGDKEQHRSAGGRKRCKVLLPEVAALDEVSSFQGRRTICINHFT